MGTKTNKYPSFGRRRMLQGTGAATMGGLSMGLVGCGGDDDDAPSGSTPSGSDATQPGGSDQTPDAGGPTRGGEYVVPATTTYTQHDPHTALGPNVWHVIGERAFEQHATTGELLPNLVESYEIEDDGLTFLLHVRPNVAMHDIAPVNGRNFDAEDLAWNLNRAYGNTAEAEDIPLASFQRRSLMGGMDTVEAVDDRTVRVTMERRNSSFLNGLAENRMMMMPREAVDVGFDDPTVMAGPGAFQISEFQRDEKMTFTRFDNYFMEGQPYFDRYEQIVVADRSAMVSAFIGGDISALGALQAHEITALQAAVQDTQLFEGPDANQMQFRPNMTYEPFRDFRVRKALQLALDYKDLADGYWGSGWEYMSAFHSSFPEAWSSDRVSQLPGYNPETTDADRTDALLLLEQAGYPNGSGINFEMLCVEQIPDTVENALRMQDQWKSVFSDIETSIQSYPDLAAYSRPQSEGAFDAVSYIITAVPDAVLEAITQNHSNGSRNYGAFSNEDLDRILDEAEGELDFDARSALMDEFQDKYMNEWQPIIWLYVRPQKTILQSNIGGYEETFGPWLGYGAITDVKHWYTTS